MNYLKIDLNKSNTIIEIAGNSFVDLEAHEFEVQSNYDFPAGQPIIFYKWDTSLGVLVNDESVIETFYDNEGSLPGLDLTPHVEYVTGGEMSPFQTNDVIISGINFSPFSEVEISGDGNFVNTVYFEAPTKLRANITAGASDGSFNVIIKNDKLNSDTSGFEKLIIKSKTIVDLRTIDSSLLGLEVTNGVTYTQDSSMGLKFESSSNSWNRGAKFSNYTWNRNDHLSFDLIFIRTKDTIFMAGIGSTSLDVNPISSPYYKQEIGFYHSNTGISNMYGGGDVANWSQNIGASIYIEKNIFYKFCFHDNGESGANCCIFKLNNADDWDGGELVHTWVSNNQADDVILTPFIIPQSGNNGYYITGFRY